MAKKAKAKQEESLEKKLWKTADKLRKNAFTSTGLTVPLELQNFPRTIFKKTCSFYDQIAWFTNQHAVPELSLTFQQGGIYDFRDKILSSRNYSLSQLSYRISDHFPLWAEFSTI